MKILLVTEFFPGNSTLRFTGGVEARTFFTARCLAKKDKVIVICRKTSSLKRQKKIGNLFIYPCGFKSIFLEANFLSIFERLFFIIAAFFQGLELDYDLVEGSNFITYLPAYFLGLIKNKPAISWYADVLKGKWLKYFGITGIFGEIIEAISLKLRWSKIIALSQSTKKKLIKAGINPAKIQVIYGGVDKELRIKRQKKDKTIICISRLVKYKRVADLINAFSRLVSKYPDLSLTIIGQGPQEINLKKLVKERNLTGKICFIKNLSRQKLMNLLARSYLFCLPSVVEGFGLATIEAASLGIPYVISDIDVNKEITHDGKGGLLFKRKNIIDLSKKLEMLLRDKKLYLKKQSEGFFLAKNYNWEIITQQTRKVYQEALND